MTEAPPGRLRYPGSFPFDDDELSTRLFCGRETEIDEVVHSILSHNLFVLYARSGVGKTSLLQAGVIPRLRSNDLWPVVIRLSEPSSPGARPFDVIRDALEASDRDRRVDVLIDDAHGSGTLRERLKAAQDFPSLMAQLEIWHRERQRFLLPVLIFDQFEELFTLWSASQRVDLVDEFAGVVRGSPVVRGNTEDVDASAPTPGSVKIVIALREDYLGSLESFSRQVPQILANRWRLEPLRESAAREAIRDPARVDHPELRTRPFRYDDSAVQKILADLKARPETPRRQDTVYTDDAAVEAYQLQLVCHHLENEKVRARQTEEPGEVVLSIDDVTGEASARAILKATYAEVVKKVKRRRDRRTVRTFCEEELIRSDGRRRPVDVDEKMRPELAERLPALEEARIVRPERRGDIYIYELSHDSLIEPVLEYKRERDDRVRQLRNRVFAFATVVFLLAGAALFVRAITTGDGGSAPAAEAAPPPTPISVGDVERGNVTDPTDVAEFSYTAAGAEVLALSLVSDDGAASFEVEVRDEGQTIAQGSSWTGEETGVIPAILPQAGDYLLRVRSTSGTGTFSLGVDDVDTRALTDDRVIEGSLDGAADLAAVRFEPEAGSVITARLSPARGFDGVLEVGRAGDAARTSRDRAGVGKTEVLTEQLDVAGSHVVLIRGADDTFGAYSLLVEVSEPIEAGRPTGDRRLSAEGAVDVYTISADGSPPVAGAASGGGTGSAARDGDDGTPAVASLVLDSLGALDGTLDVVELATGKSVARADRTGAGDPESLTVVLDPSPGPYLVQVEGADGTLGDYRLAYEVDAALPIPAGEQRLEPTGAAHHHVFEGEAGEVVRLAVSGEIDAVVELVAPDGSRVAAAAADAAGPGGTEVVAWVLPGTGTHVVRVTDFGGAGGSYALDLATVEVTDLSGGGGTMFALDGFGGEVVTVVAADRPVVIVGPAGDRVADVPAGESQVTILPADGASMALVGAEPDSVEPLEPGRAVTRALAEADADVFFTFPGSTDELVTLTMEMLTPELDGAFEVVDPKGDRLVRVDARATDVTETTPLVLPTGGTYVVRVEGSTAAGRFTLRLAEVVDEVIKVGVDAGGAVGSPHEVDAYRFAGRAGDVMAFEVAPDPAGLDAVVSVFGDDGELLEGAESNNAEDGGTERLTVVVPVDGSYRVLVRGFGRSEGTYRLSWSRLEVRELEVGAAPERYDLADGSQIDAYSFFGRAEQQVRVRLDTALDGTAGYPGRFRVFDPEGFELASLTDDEDVDNDLMTLILQQGGVHTVLVGGPFGSGPYALAIERTAFVPLERGVAFTDRIDDRREADEFSFEGTRGETVLIELIPTDISAAGFRGILDIIEPGGGTGVIRSIPADPGPSVGTFYVLDRDGPNYLRVRAQGASIGGYTIEVSTATD